MGSLCGEYVPKLARISAEFCTHLHFLVMLLLMLLLLLSDKAPDFQIALQ